jgi:hypothetical protein
MREKFFTGRIMQNHWNFHPCDRQFDDVRDTRTKKEQKQIAFVPQEIALAIRPHPFAAGIATLRIKDRGARKVATGSRDYPAANLGRGKAFHGRDSRTRRNDLLWRRRQPVRKADASPQSGPFSFAQLPATLDLARQVPLACERRNFGLCEHKALLRRALQMLQRSFPALGQACAFRRPHRHHMRCDTGVVGQRGWFRAVHVLIAISLPAML